MSTDQLPTYEKLPSGKTIIRHFDEDGSLNQETHGYGMLEIAIQRSFQKGIKTDEMYFVKQRMVSRRSYEKNRVNYSDMPSADVTLEDFGSLLLRDVRAQQRQNKAEREKRLAASQESRFPRPTSTNWLRVISIYKAHLVVFASRDWKALSREQAIPTGREWLRVFGFLGPPGRTPSVAKGLEIGFEVPGETKVMLEISRSLLSEVIAFCNSPPERSYWQGSIRPRPKPRPPKPLSWPDVLPPLIEFLLGVEEPKVVIFNHHQ